MTYFTLFGRSLNREKRSVFSRQLSVISYQLSVISDQISGWVELNIR
ncbi:hypothetical protein [Microcystis aeruginosa]|nr:hypothetical protein [Microcystis aeruginosa]